MSRAGTNLGQDIERIAKYPSDFLGNKNSYHNVTIVTGTFSSDKRFFFSNYLTLKVNTLESDISMCKLVSNLSIYYGVIKEFFNFV